MRLCGPQILCGHYGEKKCTFPVPARSLVTVVTEVLLLPVTNVTKVKRKGKVKGKVPVLLLTEHHAMKASWGSGGIAPLIL
jgi:hypothetical protein